MLEKEKYKLNVKWTKTINSAKNKKKKDHLSLRYSLIKIDLNI
jgi:hypothetical protein